jgi:outer membrane protein OmpA-like peptidoglycan-associated protein
LANDLKIEPNCPLKVKSSQTLFRLYRAEAANLERQGTDPAAQLVLLEAASRYGTAWEVYSKIGDLKRRLPNASGQPDYAGISLAYQRALTAMDAVGTSGAPANAEAERIAALAYQFRALAPEFVSGRDMMTSRTARNVLVERIPTPIQFVFDSDQMTDKGRKGADEIFDVLKDEHMPRVRLIGHTDPKGTDDYNDKLSMRRANAIKSYLTERGYPVDRIMTEGRGKRDVDKLKIVDKSQFTVDQIHEMLRRVELSWTQ